MVDEGTYDALALQLEQKLSKHSCINWHVNRYDEMLGAACISDEDAQVAGTTPDAYFNSMYKQMLVRFQVDIEHRELSGYTYIGRSLIESVPDHARVIKGLVAEQIALKLTEDEIV